MEQCNDLLNCFLMLGWWCILTVNNLHAKKPKQTKMSCSTERKKTEQIKQKTTQNPPRRPYWNIIEGGFGLLFIVLFIVLFAKN